MGHEDLREPIIAVLIGVVIALAFFMLDLAGDVRDAQHEAEIYALKLSFSQEMVRELSRVKHPSDSQEMVRELSRVKHPSDPEDINSYFYSSGTGPYKIYKKAK